MKKVNYVLILLCLSACSGAGVKRVTVDESRSRPSWTNKDILSWEDGDRFYFKTKQTVRGDQRLNGCYVIASNDNRETMLRGIVDQIRGQTDEAQTDISENAELILGKVRSGEWSGKLYGFKDESQYFERYQIRDLDTKSVVERIDCYTLSSVSRSDYEKTKAEIANKIVAIDPRVKEAIVKKQESFFKPKEEPAQEQPKPEAAREPANEPAVVEAAAEPVSEPAIVEEPMIPEAVESSIETAYPEEVKKVQKIVELGKKL